MTAIPAPHGPIEPADPTAQGVEHAAGDWSATFDAMNDMVVCLLDRGGTVLRCNESMTRLLGLALDDVLGKKCCELMHGSKTFFAKCPYQEMLRTGERESFELPLGERWYQVTAEPHLDEAGDIVGAVHVVRDITEMHAAREALAEESRWLEIINTLALELASLAAEADVGVFLARRLRELTGATAVAFSEYEPDEHVLATRVIDILPGTMKTLTAPILRRLQGTRSPVSAEDYQTILQNANAAVATLTEASFGAVPPAVDVAVRKVLGVDRFVGLAYVIERKLYGTSVIALKAGSPDPSRKQLDSIAALGAVSLRRRRAERELLMKTVELDQLFALSGDLLGIADTAGVIHRVNPAWEDTFGRSVAEFEGHPMLEFSKRPWRPRASRARSWSGPTSLTTSQNPPAQERATSRSSAKAASATTRSRYGTATAVSPTSSTTCPRNLQRVRAAAQRMGELIDALLALSRVGHRDIALRQVDLTVIAARGGRAA